MSDLDRMLNCSVCGARACFGFGVTLDGIRMGDSGDWRCEEHHPTRKAGHTREEWARARADGKLYPDDAETMTPEQLFAWEQELKTGTRE